MWFKRKNSTFSIPKLLCRILNEYSNGSLGLEKVCLFGENDTNHLSNTLKMEIKRRD